MHFWDNITVGRGRRIGQLKLEKDIDRRVHSAMSNYFIPFSPVEIKGRLSIDRRTLTPKPFLDSGGNTYDTNV